MIYELLASIAKGISFNPAKKSCLILKELPILPNYLLSTINF